MDPLIGSALIGAGVNAAGALLGNRNEKQPLTDIYTREKVNVAGPSGEEAILTRLAALLGRRGMETAAQPIPGELDLGRLIQGLLSPESTRRIHEQAFTGLNEGLRLAGNQAAERALAAGNYGSSAMAGETAYLQQPLISEATGREQAMRGAEVERLTGLRQSLLSNMLALQESPTLTKLLQARLASAGRETTQMQREPGRLPGFAYGG